MEATENVYFQFQPKWREELVCSCRLGSFSLEMTMGSAQEVYLPTAEVWAQKAPAWARPLWAQLHDQLVSWCSSRVPLHVVDNAPIY